MYVPYQGAFTYVVRFLDKQVGQAASDFTKYAYVVKYLIRVGRYSGVRNKHTSMLINFWIFFPEATLLLKT